MRIEIKQLLRASRFLGSWLVLMSLIYLAMTAYNWTQLSIEDFQALKQTHWHEMYV